MNISKLGLSELGAYEGLSLIPYLCAADVKSVGFGSTKSDIPDLDLWPWTKEITIAEAVMLFKQGMQKYVNAVNRALTKLSIPQHQFDALVCLAYNIGVGGIAKSSAMRKVNAGDTVESICKSIKQWNKITQNGKLVVSQGLVNRRAKECALFANGIYASKGYVNQFNVDPKTHKPIYKNSVRINLMQYI